MSDATTGVPLLDHPLHAPSAFTPEALHYVPASATVAADTDLAKALGEELVPVGLPVVAGSVWTTDAPYRETRERLDRHAADGVLAVEMQAAALYAFGAARGVRCGIVAHVTNAVGRSRGDQFHKGSHPLGFEILTAMYRAGRRCLTHDLISSGPQRLSLPETLSGR